MTARHHVPPFGPTRPDREMERRLQTLRYTLALSGLHPDDLPWMRVGPYVVSKTSGRVLGQSHEPDQTPYFDRWHHRRPGD